jgi:hypothetical protein
VILAITPLGGEASESRSHSAPGLPFCLMDPGLLLYGGEGLSEYGIDG